MREPGEEIEREQKHEDSDHPAVFQHSDRTVTEVKHKSLPHGESRNAQKRTHRTPFGQSDIADNDKEKNGEDDEDVPDIIAGETEPEETERRCDPLSALEFHSDRPDMPDNDEEPAKVAHKIGNKHLRSRKHIAAEDEKSDKRRDTALAGIEQEIDKTDLEPELAAHVHRAGIPASDLMDVLMLALRDNDRKIEAADEVADDRHQQKPIPALRKCKLRHSSSFLLRTLMIIGVPEKSYAPRMTFSRYRS